ncbi:MAG: hypothetical protein HQ589_07435 [Syntrophaceae bacterium]|nr:hypothetical protein [Syntrophaceae bacterium]
MRLPFHGWLGIALAVIFWSLNWSLSGLRTQWGFFPMWLGYCLTVDAIVCIRKGSSLLTRNPVAYVCLFIISIPSWWLFEFINGYTQNWHYEGRQSFTDLQYFLLSSLSFSTVMPAVFGTSELISTLKWVNTVKSGPKIKPRPVLILTIFVAGLLMFYLLLSWPLYFFPFVWVSVFFILEPLNVWLKNRSLFQYTAEGNWQPIISLCTGCLICGFFWEMWNFYSYPKWMYRVPFVDFLHIFEMPILGYGGYLPFSLELFALYHLITGLLKTGTPRDFIRF